MIRASFSHGVPACRQDGMPVGFGATAKHRAFDLMGGTTAEAHRDGLAIRSREPRGGPD